MNTIALRSLLALLLITALAPAAHSDVLISELCDPHDNYLTDRFIEIWNSGPAAVNLTGWKLVAVGNTDEIFTWNLSGSIAPGEALVAGAATTVDVFDVDFADDGWANSNGTWNGKVGDGARLKNASNVTVDDIVVPVTTFENDQLERNANITAPTTSYNASEWTDTPVDLPSEATPGTHHALPTDGPSIGTIVTDPVTPLPGQTVDVYADVTDGSAVITGVHLDWGTASGVLTGSLAMTWVGGDTYQTVTPIPAHGSGTTIHYAVTATNDVPAETVSPEQSYLLFADTSPPYTTNVSAYGPTTVEVVYSEDVDTATASDVANYTVGGSMVLSVAMGPGSNDTAVLTVTTLETGAHVLTIDGVEDLVGNATSNLAVPFDFYGGNVPPGYYNPALGLKGTPLRAALHGVIDNHTSISYSGIWSAFYTTDDKPNGKVWDMYSDVPGGTPPYEYTFGTDQGGSAGSEGSGYNREHSWPSSWYGATSPMYTDLFMVYPTDNEVNNKRGSYPFGEVTSPTWTSLNGCRLGSNTYPGYSGTVFEPIDEYKGDFARAYFYMTTRYYGEDGSWPGSPMTSGANLATWAENLLIDWHLDDPVSLKEIERNDAVYAIQSNRNPFIDNPDFALRMFRPEVSPVPLPEVEAGLVLFQNVPNPFNPSTVIAYEIDEPAPVSLQVFDLQGRLVRTLYRGHEDEGRHQKTWLGRDQRGHDVAAGVYFYRIQAGDEVQTRRMLLAK